MSKTYFVTGNLNHDGVPYVKGDTIDLETDVAKVLLKDGILSVKKVEPAPEVITAEENKESIARAEAKAKEKAAKENAAAAKAELDKHEPENQNGDDADKEPADKADNADDKVDAGADL